MGASVRSVRDSKLEFEEKVGELTREMIWEAHLTINNSETGERVEVPLLTKTGDVRYLPKNTVPLT